ncbi:Flp pilus assembly protein CpaB [Denitrificimonas sp. JX-1]|uniref:Flp pilus assembly protein CpaB n=1 Tax=Denitrificimonas halotolerans TaxID=3098930 RepID=A0ABU5GS58_9GAMM|nr:Flp pilus assembly protein CpaB [Denitrificimonas sp. JX-1]MDY7219520.1 Flp pilus assembly protein CpaB [Denitrificimonas sp. JX-1]
MNSKLTMALAGLLIIAALIAGYWGIKLSSSEPEPEPQPVVSEETELESEPSVQAALEQTVNEIAVVQEDLETVPVVVLARTLEPHVPLTAEDFAIERLKIAPPGSFSDIEEVLQQYKTVWRQVPKGSILNPSHFEVGSPLSRMIRPNERAISLAVDPVVAGGGHLMPGDFVDVLLYLRESEKNSDQTAQVVLPALRLLTIGDTFGLTTQGEPAVVKEKLSEEEARRQRTSRPEAARNVVLAVPAALVNRFLLATQVQGGKVQLAARSADEKLMEKYLAEGGKALTAEEQMEQDKVLEKELERLNRELFQFEKLAMNKTTAPRRAAAPSYRGTVPQQAPTIEVMRGAQVTRQNP